LNRFQNARVIIDLKATGVVVLFVCGLLAGCEDSKPTAPPTPRPTVPLAIRRGDAPTRVFTGEDEIPKISYGFDGGKGSVRVTMEVEGISGSTPVTTSLNDVLFKAEGQGRISVAFRRPWPEHPNGQVTIGCVSGSEDSSAVFEPELWFHQPGAIITLESPLGEPSNPVVEGKEVVLARYVARNISRDLRLTFKAVFTREPVAPRTKAGIKPPR
jgi:hypothetical protein